MASRPWEKAAVFTTSVPQIATSALALVELRLLVATNSHPPKSLRSSRISAFSSRRPTGFSRRKARPPVPTRKGKNNV